MRDIKNIDIEYLEEKIQKKIDIEYLEEKIQKKEKEKNFGNNYQYLPNDIKENNKVFYKALNFMSLFDSRPTSQTPSDGRVFNASTMWSPRSSSGLIYEWNRGVIGINSEGMVSKEKLDGTLNHHADATIRVARDLGVILGESRFPFAIAVAATQDNLLIFQSEGDCAFVYFPSEMSEAQVNELQKIVNPREGFSFSYTHNGIIYEEMEARDVLEFASSISLDRISLKSA